MPAADPLQAWTPSKRVFLLMASALILLVPWHAYGRSESYRQLVFSTKNGNNCDSDNDRLGRMPLVPWLVNKTVTERNQFVYPGHAKNVNKGGKLCVIARTYAKQATYLPVFLLSIAHGGLPSRIFLVNSDEKAGPTSDLKQASDVVNSLLGDPNWAQFVDVPSRHTVANSKESKAQDYGYAATDDVLDWLYKQDESKHQCSHLMVTNGDNLYVRDFAWHTEEALSDPNVDVMAFNFISRYRREEPLVIVDGKWRDVNAGTYKPLDTWFAVGSIDLGAAILRFDFMKKHRLFFDSVGDYAEDSDGKLLEKVAGMATEGYISRSVLFVHQ